MCSHLNELDLLYFSDEFNATIKLAEAINVNEHTYHHMLIISFEEGRSLLHNRVCEAGDIVNRH